MEATSERNQKKRRKNLDNNSLRSRLWKMEKIHFRDLQMSKKEERKREEKRKEKEERGTKKAGKRPSDWLRRCAILGGASGRFWLGQAHWLWRLTPSPPHCPTQNSRDKKEIIGKNKENPGSTARDTPGVLFCALGGKEGGHSFFRSRSVLTCESWIWDGEKALSQDSIFVLFSLFTGHKNQGCGLKGRKLKKIGR